jgi:hypothetical protein
MEIQPGKTVKKIKRKSKAKVKKTFTKADAFLLFEAEGIGKETIPFLLTYRQKELLKHLLLEELKSIKEETSCYFNEDDILKPCILSEHYKSRKQLIESIFVKLHE